MRILHRLPRSIGFASILALLFLAACLRITPVPRETDLGAYHVSVIPNCQSASTNSHRQYEADGSSKILYYEFKCGDTTVLIRDSTLTVNGKSYGTLNQGDRVAINYGSVSVSSTRRTAER